jgi:hypothetical protein
MEQKINPTKHSLLITMLTELYHRIVKLSGLCESFIVNDEDDGPAFRPVRKF